VNRLNGIEQPLRQSWPNFNPAGERREDEEKRDRGPQQVGAIFLTSLGPSLRIPPHGRKACLPRIEDLRSCTVARSGDRPCTPEGVPAISRAVERSDTPGFESIMILHPGRGASTVELRFAFDTGFRTRDR
jgi:hypothetical protein